MKLNDKKFRIKCIEADVDQKDVAAHCGKQPAWITSMKAGNFTPSNEDVQKMASFLGCKPEDIFDEVEL